MKKMFFTAIALVAFSGASMANTIEEKKTIEPTKKEEVATKNVETKTILLDVCNRLWYSQVSFYQQNGATEEDAMELADNGFNQCLCNVYGQGC